MGSLLLAVCCAAVRIRCLERATMRFVCMGLLLIALVALARAEVEEVEGTCGGNCPSNTCSSCDCGTSPNNVNINSYCSKYSDWSQSCCQCIVQHESGETPMPRTTIPMDRTTSVCFRSMTSTGRRARE